MAYPLDLVVVVAKTQGPADVLQSLPTGLSVASEDGGDARSWLSLLRLEEELRRCDVVAAVSAGKLSNSFVGTPLDELGLA
jgi:hypothetical protein